MQRQGVETRQREASGARPYGRYPEHFVAGAESELPEVKRGQAKLRALLVPSKPR